VAPADEKALADKIQHLLAEPAERQRMGNNGRQLALQKFDWQKIAGKILTLYQYTVKGRC
jgi:glycosyltransferase involved in cell wall biosynthesis